MSGRVAAVLFLTLASLGFPGRAAVADDSAAENLQGASGRFAAARCRCSFQVPDGWVVVANPKARIALLRPRQGELAPCAFGLRPRGWPDAVARPGDVRELGDYAITIHVTHQRFREAAREAFFERVDVMRKQWGEPDAEPFRKATDYVLYGRQSGRHDADWIRSANWFGLRGVAAVGYYGDGRSEDATGYQGMDDAYRAVLSNGHWRTAIVMGDNPYTGIEFDAVVRSFLFE